MIRVAKLDTAKAALERIARFAETADPDLTLSEAVDEMQRIAREALSEVVK